MKYRIKNKGDVNLSRRDFVASGGEGSIFVKGQKAYKIYTKPERMIPVQKIKELNAIKNSSVIKPEDVLLGPKNKPVGYSMQYVHNTYSLCQLFTRAFKKRNQITTETILKLVQAMRRGVKDVHDCGILLVDLNEMNFLTDDVFREVYFIDVDSYQTRSFPATALMDSVKDWHANDCWSEDSDWFSWGVVSFQMFTGIHPYKGKHASIKKMAERMQKNVSVFNAEVGIPKMVPSFDVIPEVYRKWYEAVFEKGLREPPPVDARAVVRVIPTRRISSTKRLEISEKATFGGDVVYFESMGPYDVVTTTEGIFAGQNGKYSQVWMDMKLPVRVALTPKGSLVAATRQPGGQLFASDLYKSASISIDAECEDLMSYDGRLYLKNGEDILEVEFVESGKKRMASTRKVANVMPRATTLFPGVAIQDMLGSWYASVFPVAGKSFQLRLQELGGYKIVDAKYDSRVLMVVATQNGRYDRFVFLLDRDFDGYVARKEEDISNSGLNFVVLDKGVCAHINEKEELELFHATSSSSSVTAVKDSILGGDMRLFKKGNEVLFAKNKRLHKLSMRK